MLRFNKKRGQSIVEMSLLFPLFLLIVVGGIVDFGFAFYNMLALQQVANDAACIGAELHMQIDEVKNYIKNHSSPPMSWQEAGIYTPIVKYLSMEEEGEVLLSVELRYKSRTYTPFYQTALNATTGDDYLPLHTQVAYKLLRNMRRGYEVPE